MLPTRIKFSHEGRVVYEWEQTIDEVRIYISPPPGVLAKHLSVDIASNHLRVGLKGNPPFLDHDLASVVVVDDSTWTLQSGELEITLAKMRKAETWPGLFVGHSELNAQEQEQVKRSVTLERFQQEHPGFDFSQAEFSGNAPSNPREFMGGVSYN
ncbi:hypothetical protein BASA81_008321 [Batrachochytrium salamandrivorans]|nr:hypothetical protein BASA81_008321 [Batrachochytrium salamandrivorans]